MGSRSADDRPDDPDAGRLLRIAVTGGREFRDREAIHAALDLLYARKGAFVLVVGMCHGADAMANAWAAQKGEGMSCDPYPLSTADWNHYGKAAGPIRNGWMVKSGLDGLIAFPGGRGTANMVKQCQDAGVPVWMPYKTIELKKYYELPGQD